MYGDKMKTINSGMFLEELINSTNRYYDENNIALVNKVSIPIKINNIENNNIIGTITSASTVDYIGLYKGAFIAFEAKQTTKDKYYLSSMKKHQMRFLKRVNELGGTSFIIIHFVSSEIFFRININSLDDEIKTITIDWAKENGQEIKISYPLIINYLFS